MILQRFYCDSTEEKTVELCIDEAGRGCLFGRVYVASVVLPKDPNLFSGIGIKDSKKFSSKRKIREISDYIKQNALAYHITFVENDVIDKINILQADMKGMHESIREIVCKISGVHCNDCLAVIDGNYFTPYCFFDETKQCLSQMKHVTVEQGDSKYMGIAAASILAKTARDDWVLELCKENPELAANYGLDKNMGYGTKTHIQGIREHGITKWHRRTFGICKEFST